jgi:hypothetical protein
MLQIRPTASIHHDSESYLTEFQSAIAEWLPYPPQIAAVVTDNEAALRKAVRDSGHPSLGCFVHTIQLAVKAAMRLDEVSELLGRAKHLIKLFRHSPLRLAKLHESSKMLGEEKLQVLSWSKTRWGSLLIALRRLLILRSAINLTIDPEVSAARLSDEEWVSLQAICAILAPVEATCKGESGQQYATLSLVLLHLHNLKKLEHPVLEETPVAKLFRLQLWECIKQRFQLCSEESGFYVLGMMLDPRFRNSSCCLRFLGDPVRGIQLWDHTRKRLLSLVSKIVSNPAVTSYQM